VFLAEIDRNLDDLRGAVIIAKSAFEAALFDLQALAEDKMDETLRAM